MEIGSVVPGAYPSVNYSRVYETSWRVGERDSIGTGRAVSGDGRYLIRKAFGTLQNVGFKHFVMSLGQIRFKK